MGDLDETEIRKGNYNFLPRIILSFEGMSKNTARQTQKYQKLKKRISLDLESDNIKSYNQNFIDMSYNSLSYDYNYKLLVQTRGLTIASQITEEILAKFNPSLNLMIKEFPIFQERTETQILISDPSFEINEDFQDEEVNIIQITFDITVRGNVYSQIEMLGLIETVRMFSHVWDKAEIEKSKLASYYKFDVNQTDPRKEKGKIYQETSRHFQGTELYGEVVERTEAEVIKERDDYVPYQSVSQVNQVNND